MQQMEQEKLALLENADQLIQQYDKFEGVNGISRQNSFQLFVTQDKNSPKSVCVALVLCFVRYVVDPTIHLF